MREAEGYRNVIAAIREVYGMEVQALTVEQVAKCLSCDRRTVTALIEKKRLHAVDISNGKKHSQYRIPIESLARYLTKK